MSDDERARRLDATVEALTGELGAQGRGRIVGVSRAWRQTLHHAARVAASETTVLVTGESGTGKEVVARLVHQGSRRAARPFAAINCAALPAELVESELFGHERGAFTGAVATKIGRLELAAGGTLFLDEVGELPPLVQAKLLRVLQEREFQRLGGARTLRADVRIVAATNRNLTAALARGEFRADLFYRLNVFEIHVAPLRERPEDLLPLAEAFLEDLGRTLRRPAAGLSRDGRACLLHHPWPGNVRELRNAIERAILLCDGGLITAEHLPAPPAPRRVPTAADPPLYGGMNLGALDRSSSKRPFSPLVCELRRSGVASTGAGHADAATVAAVAFGGKREFLLVFVLAGPLPQQEPASFLAALGSLADMALRHRDLTAAMTQARQVQTSLLLAEPPVFPGYEIACGSRPAAAVGGDDLAAPRRTCLDDGGELGRTPPAAAPDRVVGIALLELDPDAGAGRGNGHDAGAGAGVGGGWHRPGGGPAPATSGTTACSRASRSGSMVLTTVPRYLPK